MDVLIELQFVIVPAGDTEQAGLPSEKASLEALRPGWLNQAEIEMLARQCLGRRRIPDLSTLQRGTRAWNRRVNRSCQNQLEIRSPSRSPQVPLQKEIFHAVKDLGLAP